MKNVDAVGIITENMQKALCVEGVNFSLCAFEDDSALPASLLPHGQILYTGETFEYAHGQRPAYAEAGFVVKLLFNAKDAQSLTRDAQTWVHNVRGALTIDALNSGGLASAKRVSRVIITGVEVSNKATLSKLTCRLNVRYREA